MSRQLNTTIIDLFHRQVIKNPDAIAIVYEEEELTYSQLDKQANRLAHYLQSLGVREGSLVPLCIGRSKEMIIGMMGVLKSGAAYVPIDPDYPKERIAYIMGECGSVVVTVADCVAQLPVNTHHHYVLLDADSNFIDQYPDSFPNPGITRQHLAYVIYTSGSTGKPKGVMVEHGNIATYTKSIVKRFKLHDCNSFAILGSFAADAVFTAVVGSLCFGKSLNVISKNNITDLHALAAYLSRHPIDCFKLTPSLLEVYLEFNDPVSILPKRKLVLGGEPCLWEVIDRALALLPKGYDILNHYGPTETTAGTVTHRFTRRRNKLPNQPVPLGKLLPHVGGFILDDSLQPVPVGEIGELYLSGPSVTRGYVNNPQLTAERYITHTIEGETIRLYRTGDRVKYLEDGNMTCLGRVDDQVKIRGYRVELGEIEAVLQQSGLVSQCTVLLKTDSRNTKRLVAYIVPRGLFQRENIITYAQQQLPSYMIPSVWIPLERMPLSANSKTDKKSLPEINTAALAAAAYVAPRTAHEKEIAAIWEKLLGVERVGVYDTFAELGGHSLLFVKLSLELVNRFGIEIPAAVLFEELTVEKQAAFVSNNSTAAQGDTINVPAFDEQEVSIAQQLFFIRKKLFPETQFPNSSAAFELCGPVNIKSLESAFTTVIRLNENLRTAYVYAGSKVRSVVHDHFTFELKQVQAGEAAIDEVINTLTQSFDPGVVPMLRVFYIKLAGDKNYLYVDMPHINSDGVSLEVMMQEVAELYNHGYNRDRPKLQFRDFLRQSHQYTHSPQYARDEAFWSNQLAGIQPVSLFPAAVGNRKAGKFEGASVAGQFHPVLTSQLNNFVQGKSFTRFQFLFSCYFLFIHKITGARDITTMIPVQNRNYRHFDTIIGLLTNTVLVRVKITENTSLQIFINNCKNIITRALAHQAFPFERVYKLALKENSTFKKQPLYETFFNFHHDKAEIRLSGTLLKPYVPEINIEPLPLSLAITDAGNELIYRISSVEGIFDKSSLSELSKIYLELVEKVITANGEEPIEEILESTHLLI